MKTLIPSSAKSHEHTYNVGNCLDFAIALHRLTNAPLVSIAKKKLLPESQWYGEEEYDKFDFEHAHCGVLISKNIIADVNGIHAFTPDNDNCHWHMRGDGISESYLENFGDDELLIESYYAAMEEDIIEQAKLDAVKWGCVAMINRVLKRSIEPDFQP